MYQLIYRHKQRRLFLLPQKNDNIHFEHHVKWELCHAIPNKTYTVNSESREAIRKKISSQMGVRMREAEQNFHSTLGVITRNTKKIVNVNMRKTLGIHERKVYLDQRITSTAVAI